MEKLTLPFYGLSGDEPIEIEVDRPHSPDNSSCPYSPKRTFTVAEAKKVIIKQLLPPVVCACASLVAVASEGILICACGSAADCDEDNNTGRTDRDKDLVIGNPANVDVDNVDNVNDADSDDSDTSDTTKGREGFFSDGFDLLAEFLQRRERDEDFFFHYVIKADQGREPCPEAAIVVDLGGDSVKIGIVELRNTSCQDSNMADVESNLNNGVVRDSARIFSPLPAAKVIPSISGTWHENARDWATTKSFLGGSEAQRYKSKVKIRRPISHSGVLAQSSFETPKEVEQQLARLLAHCIYDGREGLGVKVPDSVSADVICDGTRAEYASAGVMRARFKYNLVIVCDHQEYFATLRADENRERLKNLVLDSGHFEGLLSDVWVVSDVEMAIAGEVSEALEEENMVATGSTTASEDKLVLAEAEAGIITSGTAGKLESGQGDEDKRTVAVATPTGTTGLSASTGTVVLSGATYTTVVTVVNGEVVGWKTSSMGGQAINHYLVHQRSHLTSLLEMAEIKVKREVCFVVPERMPIPSEKTSEDTFPICCLCEKCSEEKRGKESETSSCEKHEVTSPSDSFASRFVNGLKKLKIMGADDGADDGVDDKVRPGRSSISVGGSVRPTCFRGEELGNASFRCLEMLLFGPVAEKERAKLLGLHLGERLWSVTQSRDYSGCIFSSGAIPVEEQAAVEKIVKESEDQGLIGLVFDAIHAARIPDIAAGTDSDARNALFSNIVLCGGNMQFAGMAERVQKELSFWRAQKEYYQKEKMSCGEGGKLRPVNVRVLRGEDGLWRATANMARECLSRLK